MLWETTATWRRRKMQARHLAIYGAASTFLSMAPVTSYADADAYHACGPAPQVPGLFDPQTADQQELINIKAEFEAYSSANTAYIDCLKTASVSDSVQSLKRRQRKKAMQELEATLRATDAQENEFARAFRAEAKRWAAMQ